MRFSCLNLTLSLYPIIYSILLYSFSHSVFIILLARSGFLLTICENSRMISHSSSKARSCLCFRTPFAETLPTGLPAPSLLPPLTFLHHPSVEIHRRQDNHRNQQQAVKGMKIMEIHSPQRRQIACQQNDNNPSFHSFS